MLGYALIAVFTVVATAHLVMAFFRIVLKRPGYSSVPIVNCLIGVLALWTIDRSQLWWVAFVLDWGGLPLAIETLIWRARLKDSV